MLEVDSVSIRFGNKSILAGCYLSCKPGEIIGLLGRNGSGKSTLLKIIFGSVKPDFMHLRVDDKITYCGFKSGKIGYLPQQSFMPPFYTVERLTSHVAQELLSERIKTYLNNIPETRLNNLSGGELKFLECLWVLSLPSEYLLLDEPFSGISPFQIELLQEAIKIAAKTKGIVLTDHLYRPLIEISNRIVLLHNKAIYPINEEDDLIRYNYLPDYLLSNTADDLK